MLILSGDAYLVWTETWNFKYRRTPLTKQLFHRKVTKIYGSDDHKDVSRSRRAHTASNNLYFTKYIIRTSFKFPHYDAHRIANGNVRYLDRMLEINLSSNTGPVRLQRDLLSICMPIMPPSAPLRCRMLYMSRATSSHIGGECTIHPSIIHPPIIPILKPTAQHRM